jgi:glucose/arabinose dehydrogenase
LRPISADGEVGPPIEGLPPILQRGQGGLLEVALHPDYAKNGWVYLGYSEPHPDEAKANEGFSQTKVVRGRIREGRWQDEEVIWRADLATYSRAGVHFGTRFVFHDGYLWFPIGDRGQPPLAQDLSRPEGKMFRLHDDGRIPTDNPFVKTPGALPEIWSYGHRNPQGLVRHPKTGQLFATEHGPRGGDELNLIKPGVNYGWPEVTYGMNYNGTPITSRTAAPEFASPLVQWTPSIAACGLAVLEGKRYPGWEGDLFAGGLASQQLRRIRVQDGRATEDEIALRGLGRIRDVRLGPDGLLYLVLNGPDEIVRLVLQ